MEDFIANADQAAEAAKGAAAAGAAWLGDMLAKWQGIESKKMRVFIAVGVFFAVAFVLAVLT